MEGKPIIPHLKLGETIIVEDADGNESKYELVESNMLNPISMKPMAKLRQIS